MSKKTSKLHIAQEKAESAINEANKKIVELGECSGALYSELTNIQNIFDQIRNVPSDKMICYKELKQIRLNWKHQAEMIENDYKNAVVKDAGAGAAGVGAGVAVVALGPSAAMGVATTFGVASTGTAISALNGVAATNAALAWIGGGTLATGGGGMAAGEAFLGLAGPVGWAIAGTALAASGLFFLKSRYDKRQIEDVFIHISERDVRSYNLAIVELNERISRSLDENIRLRNAIEQIRTFGLDYNQMTEEQQYELGAYVNLMSSSTQLLVNPVMGLQPKYSYKEYEEFVSLGDKKIDDKLCKNNGKLIIYLSNLLYKVNLSKRDKMLLCKTFKKNKELLNALNVKKREFSVDIFDAVEESLNYYYNNI